MLWMTLRYPQWFSKMHNMVVYGKTGPFCTYTGIAYTIFLFPFLFTSEKNSRLLMRPGHLFGVFLDVYEGG